MLLPRIIFAVSATPLRASVSSLAPPYSGNCGGNTRVIFLKLLLIMTPSWLMNITGSLKVTSRVSGNCKVIIVNTYGFCRHELGSIEEDLDVQQPHAFLRHVPVERQVFLHRVTTRKHNYLKDWHSLLFIFLRFEHPAQPDLVQVDSTVVDHCQVFDDSNVLREANNRLSVAGYLNEFALKRLLLEPRELGLHFVLLEKLLAFLSKIVHFFIDLDDHFGRIERLLNWNRNLINLLSLPRDDLD